MSPRIAHLVVALSLLLAPAVASGLAFRHRLVDVHREGGVPPGGHVLVADLNADGDDDLVRTTPGRAVCELYVPGRRSFEVFRDVTLDPDGVVDAIGDATGDGHPDLLVVIVRDSVSRLACHDVRSPDRADRPLWTAGPYLDSCRVMPKMGKRGHISVLGVLDADGDGRPEVYLGVMPYVAGGEPRKVVCLDGPTGRERWRYVLAPGATGLTLVTWRGGRERHLLLQSYAPDNGFRVGEETDAHAYVTSLSPTGRREWSLPMGGIFSGVSAAPGDFDGDGRPEILVSASLTAAESEADAGVQPTLCLLDPATGRTLRRARIPSGIMLPVVGDVDRDGRDEIVGAGQDQAIYCFDGRLAPRWVNRRRPLMSVLWVADMTGDGGREVLATNMGTIAVLDARGRLLVVRDLVDAEMRAFPLRAGGRTRVLVQALGQLAAAELERPDVSPAALVLTGGALSLGLGGAGWALRRRRRRADALIERSEAQDRLLEGMVAFGHSGSSLAILDRLRFHLRNWERVRAQPEGGAHLAALLDDFVSSVLPDLVRLGALARRARVRPRHWRPLAHQALRVSGLLQDLLERPAGAEDRRARADTVLDQVDANLRGIRAHLREVFRAEAGPLARRVLARRAAELEAAGVETTVQDRLPAGRAVFVDGTQLEKVLENLVENAVRAMSGAAERRLAVTLALDGAHCLLDVTDSGCGLPPADHERIFERSYTSHEGGGFGLYFAREALARYEGKVFLLRSAPGEGTTFRVVLRTA